MDSSSGLGYQASTKKSMTETHKSAAHWIKNAISHKGALRATLGAKAGEPIPEAKLEKAAHGSGVTAKRARLAETLRGFKH